MTVQAPRRARHLKAWPPRHFIPRCGQLSRGTTVVCKWPGVSLTRVAERPDAVADREPQDRLEGKQP